ncbi:type II secretion system protein GspI, partial [Pseudomonas aeruginosa]
MKRARGFTLLEVLVALAIFAMVAASVLSAS